MDKINEFSSNINKVKMPRKKLFSKVEEPKIVFDMDDSKIVGLSYYNLPISDIPNPDDEDPLNNLKHYNDILKDAKKEIKLSGRKQTNEVTFKNYKKEINSLKGVARRMDSFVMYNDIDKWIDRITKDSENETVYDDGDNIVYNNKFHADFILTFLPMNIEQMKILYNYLSVISSQLMTPDIVKQIKEISKG